MAATWTAKLKFLVQGSAPEPYVVTFLRRGPGNLSAYCTCPAGQHGQYCKHRVRLLIGDTTGVVGGDTDEVETVASWLGGSDIEQAMQEVRQAEAKADAAKKRLSAAKKKVARAMMD